MALTRERILEQAVDVVAAEGWDALSMRRLALELDVWPMAMYRHFRDKDELVAAVAQAAAERVAMVPGEGAWDERLAALLRDAAGSPAVQAGGAVPGGARLTSAAVAILLDAGFAPADAVTAWRTAFAYAAGFDGSAPPAAALSGLDGLPAVAITALGEPGDFETGLRLVLDAVGALRR